LKVFEKEEFRKKVVEWMVGKGQYRRKLDDLVTDITGGEDWWPSGLPDMRVNREFRGQYIKENWSEGLVRHGKSYYRIAIENVFGLYHVVRLERVSGRAHGGRRLDD